VVKTLSVTENYSANVLQKKSRLRECRFVYINVAFTGIKKPKNLGQLENDNFNAQTDAWSLTANVAMIKITIHHLIVIIRFLISFSTARLFCTHHFQLFSSCEISGAVK